VQFNLPAYQVATHFLKYWANSLGVINAENE
jgi:hypothetical protein